MKNIITALVASLLLCIPVEAQTYNFFTDSPTNTSYDYSWGFYKSPSYLQIIGQKFPVDTNYKHSGTNSLKLSWSSKAGGDWGIAVAEVGTPWPTHDVTKVDSLIFWVYSPSPIDSTKLPLLYLEDNNNLHTPTIQLSPYAPSIKANIWTKISVPVKVFVPGPNNVNLTIIKTIFFGQDAADDSTHTLYLDDIKMIAATAADTTPPAMPTGVIAKGYDMHINISWIPNTEIDLAGYNVYRSNNNSVKLIGTVTPDEHIFTDFIGTEGVKETYRVSAFDQSQNESPMSDSVSASTFAMNDSLLLDMVEEAAFRYFWDYGHPVSGMARERTNSGNTVTTGGTGFGIMALLVGVQRGFITRDQAVQRMIQILSFLANKADRFHGAFPHWMNGETGKVIP
ncbi:MAG: glucoamylase family protein, partial [Ignavibacteriaceae bacterium]